MITFIESGNRIATENFEIGEIYTITFTNGNYKTMCCIGVGSDFVMFQYKLPNALFCLTLGTAETVSTIEIGGGGSGTMNYNELENKPHINGIILVGNKTAADLNLATTTDLSDKQDTLTETQLTAVNSGITSSLVTQIGTNENNILNAYGGTVNKNKLDYTLSTLKAINTAGTWNNNVYTRGNTTFTVNDDNTIDITSLGAPSNAIFFLNLSTPNVYGGLRLNGCPNGGSALTYHMNIELSQSPYSTLALDIGNASIVGTTPGNINTYIKIDGQLSETITFKPMISDRIDTTDYQPFTYDMVTISNLLRGLI